MSAETPACQGCFTNPLPWSTLSDWSYSKVDLPINQFEPLGLTQQEKNILESLANAHNVFICLADKVDVDISEFTYAIHKAQSLIALRVARRANPEVWRTT